MSDTILEIRGLHKWYGPVHVLKGIDLSVRTGEILTVIGPSGSGKSTMLRCINHLESRDAGSIQLDGKVIGYEEVGRRVYHQREADLARMRQHIGMVFQQFNLFPHMTALENVTYGQRRVKHKSRSEARDRAAELLTIVGLAEQLDAYPSQLSGGQQQRVAIARSLALEPRLMLFDEPTSALDPELVGEVLRVIRDLADRGMTMIIVTHEIAFAEEVSNRVIVMVDGVIAEEGRPRDVIERPNNPRVADFLKRISQRSNMRNDEEKTP